LLALLWERDQRVLYIPGFTVDRARDTYTAVSLKLMPAMPASSPTQSRMRSDVDELRACEKEITELRLHTVDIGDIEAANGNTVQGTLKGDNKNSDSADNGPNSGGGDPGSGGSTPPPAATPTTTLVRSLTPETATEVKMVTTVSLEDTTREATSPPILSIPATTTIRRRTARRTAQRSRIKKS
jgi:hypothetical protein